MPLFERQVNQAVHTQLRGRHVEGGDAVAAACPLGPGDARPRAVSVSFEGSVERGVISARFLYQDNIGEVQAECVSMAETYCIADFPPAVEVAFQAIPFASRELLPGEHWVYMRWEPQL